MARGTPTTRAKLEEGLAAWCPLLAAKRDLAEDALDKYVNFVVLARAASRAALAGRGITPSDIEEALTWREAKLAEADALREKMQPANSAWQNEIQATGKDDGPAGAHVRELVKQYERCLRDAGEVNALRAWRAGLNDTADQLGLDDLLSGVILDDPHGPLTPAERGYMEALVRARVGDSSGLNAAVEAIGEQNGSDNLTLAQSKRIAETLEREAEADARAGEALKW
jgi:hypothetical protein